MRRYLRSREGSVSFFTLVTHERRAILTTERGRRCLREAIHEVKGDHPLEIVAIVLLPDHLDAIWELPRGECSDSTRWRLIQASFTRQWCNASGREGAVSPSRRPKGERRIWQRRFDEYTCRDTDDLQRCLDNVHVHLLKQDRVDRVRDWPWSSFHRDVQG